jgi:hypothetical protein
LATGFICCDAAIFGWSLLCRPHDHDTLEP